MTRRTLPDRRDDDHVGPDGGVVRVHFWAAARAAAGRAETEVHVAGPVSLADVTALVLQGHDGARLREVLAMCSVLVDDRPAGAGDHADVPVLPGQSVQYLPPFAGG